MEYKSNISKEKQILWEYIFFSLKRIYLSFPNFLSTIIPSDTDFLYFYLFNGLFTYLFILLRDK